VSVAKAVVSTQELPRLETPRCYLDKDINLLEVYIPLVPFELIFCLDETGLPDWEERRSKPVLVTDDATTRLLHCPVDRGIRHQTLLCCISASGDV
jgi:hypothetical protein